MYCKIMYGKPCQDRERTNVVFLLKYDNKYYSDCIIFMAKLVKFLAQNQ